MPKGIVREYPGGFRVLYGGTRTGVCLARPWQVVAPYDPAKCAFCRGEGKEIKEFASGWKLLENLYTPNDFHQMVIPPSCWRDNEIRILGGTIEADAAFENIGEVIAGNPEQANMHVAAYVGWLAGQNVPHLHYHIVGPRHCDHTREDALAGFMRSSERVFFWEDGIKVVAESIERAGQCFFVPVESGGDVDMANLGTVVQQVVALYARAFVSSDKGLAPDFQLFFSFRRWGQLAYGSYLPILNHLGSTDTVGAHHSGSPINHPWTSEETLAHLVKFM